MGKEEKVWAEIMYHFLGGTLDESGMLPIHLIGLQDTKGYIDITFFGIYY